MKDLITPQFPEWRNLIEDHVEFVDDRRLVRCRKLIPSLKTIWWLCAVPTSIFAMGSVVTFRLPLQ